MPWKKNDDGTLALDSDGFPIRIDSEGNESSVKDDGIDYLQRTVAESISRKNKLKELEQQLEKYQGIDDPDKAREALQTVQNLEDKKLIDAGKAEEMKRQIREQYESKMAEKDQELSKRDQQIHRLVVSNAFAKSKVINDQTILPPDVAEAYFGRYFKVENGQAIAYDSAGNVIYSKERPGEPANFDEALQAIISQHPQKDRILKAAPGGSGASSGSGTPAGRTVSRQQFEAMGHGERMAFVKDGGKIND
jgi:hypothetical protein